MGDELLLNSNGPSTGNETTTKRKISLVYEKKQKCSYSSPVMYQAVLSGAHTFLTGVITPYLYYIILAVLLQLLSSCFLR